MSAPCAEHAPPHRLLENAALIAADGDHQAFTLSTAITLECAAPLTSAVLRATAHGVFEAQIDGRPVAPNVLAPGWSSYRHRLPVEELDVLGLVHDGAVLTVLVGNGWWRGNLGFEGMCLNYGERIGFAAELELTFADGHVQRVVTDLGWTARSAQVGANSLYDGVVVDATHAPVELPVVSLPFDRSVLVPQVKPPITRQEVLAPARSWPSPDGGLLVDFGQNLVGWTRLRVRGPRGTKVTVRHAEVLEDGRLATRPLRGARATDTFVLSGGDDLFEPTLTFHGFRYAELTGVPDPAAARIEAVVVHSTMERTGTFECSDERVNALVRNAVWGQRGNFLDVPTDCPQRDERLGWTGDLAVFAPSATFHFDCADLLHGWLLDLAADTRKAGFVPFVVPDLFAVAGAEALGPYAQIMGPTAIWGDAAVWVPEALWWAYGDAARLAEHYPAMAAHLESVEARLSPAGLWDTGFQFGDWLDPTAPPDQPRAAKADPAVIATACLYRTARFAAEAALVAGIEDDHARWSSLAARTRKAFNDAYVGSDGRITSDAQAVYALAIHFGLLAPGARAAAGRRLAELVEEAGYTVATGFAGTPYVTWALASTGHVDAAYRLLLQDASPSWLSMVAMGATTIWERWDSLLPDGSVNPGEMTSFNHYALGAVVDWLYQGVAGLRPAEPGYARLLLAPTPGPGLDWARATLRTPHGLAESGWSRAEDGTLTVRCVVPDGVKADLHLPDGSSRVLDAGVHVISCPEGTAS